MDSQESKQNMTAEEFRNCYPNVSIQQLRADKQSAKTPIKATTVSAKTPPSSKVGSAIKTAALKNQTPVKSSVVSKPPVMVEKKSVVTKSALSVKGTVTPKTPVATSQVPKAVPTPVKAPGAKTPQQKNTVVRQQTLHNVLNKTPQSALRQQTPQNVRPQVTRQPTPQLGVRSQGPQVGVRQSSPQVGVRQQLPQVGVRQQIPQSAVKQQTTPAVPKTTPVKPVAAAAKEDGTPDQSNVSFLTFSVPQVSPRKSQQLTIEKIEQQQRIPVQLDANNQVMLQQVINNNGQLLLQNRVGAAETTLQSVVIGTTAQAVTPVVTPLPQVEITTSEPLQALQVTQQVTLFRPKGNTFTVEDVKKQINLSTKQPLQSASAMTNIVSSTTNPAPIPAPTLAAVPVSTSAPTPAVTSATSAASPAQPDQKKVVLPARVAVAQQSPVRQSNRVTPLRVQKSVTQYPSTRGQVRKVSPKREIPMQKVSPMQPPPPPPPALDLLANEEEVTTSEDVPAPANPATQLIVILPSGERKTVPISEELFSSSIQDLLKKMNVPLGMGVLPQNLNVLSEVGSEVDVSQEQWQAQPGAEPGEILGLQNDMEAEELEDVHAEQIVQSEVEDGIKDPDSMNSEAEQPIYREGLLAVCKFCGMTSIDFNRCPRCNRPFPPDCKTISVNSVFPQVETTAEEINDIYSNNYAPNFHLDEHLLLKNRKTKADSVTGGESPKKKRPCTRKKRAEEPVCLTISDDEELLGLAHHHSLNDDPFHSDSNSQMSSCDKEPIITDDMSSEGKYSVSGGGVGEELLDNASAAEKTFLQCRTVRIGSYKVVPKDKVLITPHGLKVTVPVLDSDQYVELKIMCHEIIKVLIHFGRQMPVLFFYTRPSAAARIRVALKMTNKNGFYYDSTSSDETHRRITFLPDKIDEDCKNTLKNIFGDPENSVFAELTGKEANDILVKASPKEVQAFILKKQPNQNQPQQVPQQLPFNGQNIQTIMVYPPPPEKGGIPINTEDYACLEIDQFLNDVIIDFYLKYVVEKTLSPEDRARTHVFSSFFYKRLTTKPPPKRKSMNPVENDPTASPAVKRHSRVKSWTKNVNLFAKDFIVIPINENSHWFLAIVCFPGLTGPVKFSDNTPVELPGRRKKKADLPETKTVGGSGAASMTIGSTTITAMSHGQMLDVGDDVEDRDEADGEAEELDVPDMPDEELVQKAIIPEIKEEVEEEQPVKKQREPIKQPCILIFDSLAGASRSRVVATLRDYLRVEYEAKNGETRDFSGDVMKGTNLKCPQQTNYTDCGLYVLQYVEAFFQWPITDYHIPIKQCQDWFQVDIVNRKRYEIQQLLHRLMGEQHIDIEALNLPILNLRPEGKNLVEYSGTEDEEEDEDQMCEDEEDDLLDEEEFNEDMEHEEMEEGEIGHHDDVDPDNYLDPSMEHEEHEMDEEGYAMEEEEDEEDGDDINEEMNEELLGEKELEDVSLTPLGPVKADQLKNYRIPRLSAKTNSMSDVYKED